MDAENLPFVKKEYCYWNVIPTGDDDEDYKLGVSYARDLHRYMEKIGEPLMLLAVIRDLLRRGGLETIAEDKIAFGFFEEIGRIIISVPGYSKK